jgi:hypothetical protein
MSTADRPGADMTDARRRDFINASAVVGFAAAIASAGVLRPMLQDSHRTNEAWASIALDSHRPSQASR